MKGNFWRKIFRSGYNARFPKGSAAHFNGWCAKTDPKSTRTRLKNFLNKLQNEAQIERAQQSFI